MPFEGFISEVSGQPVTPDECLACARAGAPGCPMTAPVVQGILDGLRPDDFGLTVTTLLACPRKERLKRERPYYLRPSQSWWAYRGALMHGVAAAYASGDPHAIAETRFSLLVELPAGDTIRVSGQPDLVFVDRRHLIDYKTTRRVPRPWLMFSCPETGAVIQEGQWMPRAAILACPHCALGEHPTEAVRSVGAPRPYPRHVQQVSLYRLILWENGVQVETAEIVYQDMAEQVRVEAGLIPLDETWNLLRVRLLMHTQADLPEVLTDPTDLWECDWCPVREVCQELNGGPAARKAPGERGAE